MDIFIVTSRVELELDPPVVFSNYKEASAFMKKEYESILEDVVEQPRVAERTFYRSYHARVESVDGSYEWFLTPVKVEEMLFTTVDTGEYCSDQDLYFQSINKTSHKVLEFIRQLWR